jgi:hypothetical protein
MRRFSYSGDASMLPVDVAPPARPPGAPRSQPGQMAPPAVSSVARYRGTGPMLPVYVGVGVVLMGGIWYLISRSSKKAA